MRLLSLLLLPALALGCMPAREIDDPMDDLPCLTCEGRTLHYTVGAGQQQYPFVATVTQNDGAGLAFDYDLGNGNQRGSVTMTPAARMEAMAFMNQFGSDDYTLDRATSVFLSQAAYRTAKDDGSVTLDFGGNDGTAAMTLADCTEDAFVTTAMGETVGLPACTLEGPGGKSLTILDDDDNPLILSMNTGSFTVALDYAE